VQKRALITGITGQDGSYLADWLLSEGYEVVGMVRRSSTLNFERIAHIQDRLTLVSADVLDEVSIVEVLREHRPDEVYNLAAQSFVQTSWGQPVLTGEVTALGVTRVLDAIRLTNPEIRFYQASSSEMFGKVREVPQTLLPPQSLRSGEGLWALDHRELPRELRIARLFGDPVQPREPAPGSRIRHAEGHQRRSADQARPRS
jgi:GDPmannose 4,6-dehydratase